MNMIILTINITKYYEDNLQLLQQNTTNISLMVNLVLNYMKKVNNYKKIMRVYTKPPY